MLNQRGASVIFHQRVAFAALTMEQMNMNFPGNNSLKISKEALSEMIATAMSEQLGTQVRVINIDWGVYAYAGIAVEFTTNPEHSPEVSP